MRAWAWGGGTRVEMCTRTLTTSPMDTMPSILAPLLPSAAAVEMQGMCRMRCSVMISMAASTEVSGVTLTSASGVCEKSVITSDTLVQGLGLAVQGSGLRI